MLSPSPTTRDELSRVIAHARLFRGLDAGRVRALADHASLHRLAQGEQLWREGQRAEHFHVVLRGVLELQRSVPGADTSLVAFFGPGESPGVPVALERGSYIASSYAAAPVVEVLSVRAEPVLEALLRDPALAMAVNRALLDHCRLLHAKIDVLAAGTVPRRLAALMLELAERFGDEMEDGSTFVPLPLTRAQIATYVGARVETVIRCCTGWERAGILTKSSEGLAIPCVAALRAIVRGDESALRECRRACPCPTLCASPSGPRGREETRH